MGMDPKDQDAELTEEALDELWEDVPEEIEARKYKDAISDQDRQVIEETAFTKAKTEYTPDLSDEDLDELCTELEVECAYELGFYPDFRDTKADQACMEVQVIYRAAFLEAVGRSLDDYYPIKAARYKRVYGIDIKCG